jgi:hypothetical protein
MSEKTISSILRACRDHDGNPHDANTAQKYADRFEKHGITYASLMQFMREHKDKALVRVKLNEVEGLPAGVYIVICNEVSLDYQKQPNAC